VDRTAQFYDDVDDLDLLQDASSLEHNKDRRSGNIALRYRILATTASTSGNGRRMYTYDECQTMRLFSNSYRQGAFGR
jgi:hypothetical protein